MIMGWNIGCKLTRYMVYYIDAAGAREGAEVIWSLSREEAIEEYRKFFNVKGGEVRAIPRIEAGDYESR